MRNVIVVWAKGNADLFEQNVPLGFVGQRNARLRFNSDIDILFLDGYDLLEEGYRVLLQELGFNLYDVQKIYSDFAAKYSSLNRFGDFEKKCFLRWVVISEFYSKEQIVHYDGDVVFNEDPHIMLSKMNGKTFVLQGCPALACISDANWFYYYEESLRIFSSDIEGYSKQTWIEREGWELSERYKWSGQRDRKIIGSDQDLISHLIHGDKIPQSKPSEVLNCFSEYILFENPLYIHAYSPWCETLPFSYKRIDDIDYINGKRVAFWHMQNYFINYLVKYINTSQIIKLFKLRLPNDLTFTDNIVPNSITDLSFSKADKFKATDGRLLNLLLRIIGKIRGRRSRLEIYRLFFDKADFSSIFNNQVWWKDGVFK